MAAFSVQLDYLQEILGIESDDAFVDSTHEKQLINRAIQKTTEMYNWPEYLKRDADVIVANLNRYDIPSDFRKFDFMFVQGRPADPTSLQKVRTTKHSYAVDKDADEYITHVIPQTASTAYTLSNNETAASSVVIELDTVSGLNVQDEIWIDDSTSSEFTQIQSVDTTNTTITAKLANAHNAAIILYKTDQINFFGYYFDPTDLSSDSDIAKLPTTTHFILCYYAAYLYLTAKEEFTTAQGFLNTFTAQLSDAWLKHDKLSTGQSNEFTI